MRKGTKKNIIHGILIIIVIIFALMASLVAAFRDVTVQSMIARSVAGEMAQRLNADVKIKTFYITEKMEICLEDVQINDVYGYPLFMIGKMDARITPTVNNNELRFKDIYMKDVLGRLVKYEGGKNLNFKDLFAQLGGEKKEKKESDDDSDFHLKVDNFRLDNGHVVYWNQNKDKPEKLSMDWAHIDIDSIYGVFSNLEVKHDSVLGYVHTLRGKDKCGLVLDDASGDVLFCEKCLNIDSLKLVTGESNVDLDLRFEYNASRAYYEFVDSVRIIGNIRPSTLLLSDLKYFSWILHKMPDKFNFTAYYDGTVRDFTVSNFVGDFGNESHIDADVSFTGLPEFYDSYMDITIRELLSSYNDTKNFAIPIESKTVPIPQELSGIGTYMMAGSYQGYAMDFKTQFSLATDMGDIDAEIYLNTTENSGYSFDIAANRLNVSSLIGMDDAETSFSMEMHGQGLEVADADFETDVHFGSLKILGNEFNDFDIHGDFENQRFITLTGIQHPNLDLDLSAMIDFKGKMPSYNIIANIRNVDFVGLNLLDTDSIMNLATNIDLQFSGNDIDNITGNLNISGTKYFNGEEYCMNDFNASISETAGIKDVEIDCDFFDFYGTGIVNAKTFMNAMKNTGKRYVNMPEWFSNTVPDTHKQEFSLSMNLKDTRQLTKLFVPSLYVSSGTTINASYTDGYSYHGSTIEAPEVHFNGLKFKNIDIRNTARFDEFVSRVSCDDFIMRDTTSDNPDPISLENIVILTTCGHDKVNTVVTWDDDDEADHTKAKITSQFVPHHDFGGLLSITSEEILVNDTSWYLHPDCRIDFRKHSTYFEDISLYTDYQKISVYGVMPSHDTDTLYARFHNVDISDLDFVTAADNLNFDGNLNGYLGISGLNENFSFSADIDLRQFHINGQEVGDVFTSAKWYEPKESIFVNMEVYNSLIDNEKHESVGLLGFYYPKKNRNNISFDLMFDDFKLETLSPFVSSVVSRMNGMASGNMNIRGSLNAPVITGDLKLNNAGCKVNYLNTYYTLNDNIKLEKDKIVFEDISIQDTLGNVAKLNGVINHNHLKDFNFDLALQCNDFVALDIPYDKADGFYGTAVADGTVNIKGPVEDITMDIDVLTKKGTEIDIPLSGSSSVDNNFVVFVQKNDETDTIVEDVVPEVVKNGSSFSMNLNARVNSDAALAIFLPQNMGSLNARGNGNINLGLKNDDMTLRGDYIITSGAFNFILEVVKRTFTLRPGGSIRWTGDPTDADIDIVGVYRTKSSLTSLGSAIVDSSALTNNINVDCIIRLSDKLMNPTLNFGIELPNATEDTKNLVFSVIDTTNQAIMAQQVFSLMVIGSFSYTAGNNIGRIGTTAGYSVITSQLSNWLSQISKDFDIGINYTPNDQLTNEELEVALSTQLFDDRLIIEGNFGVIRGNRSDADNANNIVGDVDLTFRLTKRLSLKAYNHTNIKNNYYYYSFENYSDFTQGVGISFSQSFDNLREVFNLHKKNKNKNKNVDEPVPK